MNTRHIAGLCAGLAMMISGAAQAQSPGDSADELIRDANAVLVNLDEGKFDAVWADSAGFVKQRNTEPQFAQYLRNEHERIGPVRRNWASVVRIRYTNTKDIPDGLYANVDYVSDKVTGGTVFEKLSFRLEDDGHWHLTGYVPRDAKGNAI